MRLPVSSALTLVSSVSYPFPGLVSCVFIDSLVICILPQQEHAARSQLNIQIHELLARFRPPIRSRAEEMIALSLLL